MTPAPAPARGASAKRVLVVENKKTVRDALVKKLENRGFRAEGASNVAQTRSLVNEPGSQFDVAVLDMLLQDPVQTSLTGIDAGHEIRQAQHELPPEFVVYSGYFQPHHYDAAFQFGASAYIVKSTKEEDDIFSHIRSLALRRALSPIRREIGEKVEQIAEEDYDPITAVSRLCTQVIKPEIDVCLGVPFIFLLSDGKGSTRNLISDIGLPEGTAPAYEQIQNLTFNTANDNGPFVFKLEDMAEQPSEQSDELFQRLEGGGFLPLHTEGDLRLSIGILRAEKRDALSAEKDPLKLGGILSAYLRPQVSKLFKYMSRIEAAIEKARTSAERMVLLKHTSKFCLYVGGTQINVLNEAVENKEIEPSNKCFRKLQKLAIDLQATGKEFSQLIETRSQAKAVAATERTISARSVVAKARKMIEEQHLFDRLELEEKGEDFNLAVEEKDLLVGVLRMLQWMAQRQDKMPPDAPHQRIEVAYEKQAGRLELRFTDQSRRLGEHLRRKLFEPFTQGTTTEVTDNGEEPPGLYLPLYLAKTLIEVKNDGLLEDKTDQLESTQGHRFVMSFPAAEEKKLTS